MAGSGQFFEKSGITNYKNLLLTTSCLAAVTIISAFIQTFINLGCQPISFFRGDVITIDGVMLTIGSIGMLPYLALQMSLRKLILFSFMGTVFNDREGNRNIFINPQEKRRRKDKPWSPS